MRLRHAVMLALAATAMACDSTDPNPLAGTWDATTFVVTETGDAPRNVIALGGGLTIVIAQNNATSGILIVPGELTGGADASFSMTGVASRTGNTVHFDQESDTFVRDLDWTFSDNTLTANQTVSGVSLAITLTRQ